MACAILGAMALAWGAQLAVAALFFSGVGCLGVALLLLAIKLYCNGRRGEPKSINRLAGPFSALQVQLQDELQSKKPPDQYAQVRQYIEESSLEFIRIVAVCYKLKIDLNEVFKDLSADSINSSRGLLGELHEWGFRDLPLSAEAKFTLINALGDGELQQQLMRELLINELGVPLKELDNPCQDVFTNTLTQWVQKASQELSKQWYLPDGLQTEREHFSYMVQQRYRELETEVGGENFGIFDPCGYKVCLALLRSLKHNASPKPKLTGEQLDTRAQQLIATCLSQPDLNLRDIARDVEEVGYCFTEAGGRLHRMTVDQVILNMHDEDIARAACIINELNSLNLVDICHAYSDQVPSKVLGALESDQLVQWVTAVLRGEIINEPFTFLLEKCPRVLNMALKAMTDQELADFSAVQSELCNRGVARMKYFEDEVVWRLLCSAEEDLKKVLLRESLTVGHFYSSGTRLRALHDREPALLKAALEDWVAVLKEPAHRRMHTVQRGGCVIELTEGDVFDAFVRANHEGLDEEILQDGFGLFGDYNNSFLKELFTTFRDNTTSLVAQEKIASWLQDNG